MRHILCVLAILPFLGAASIAQDEEKCGKNADQLKKHLAGKYDKKDLDGEIQQHLKKHADGQCHCTCAHKKKHTDRTKQDEKKTGDTGGEKPTRKRCEGNEESRTRVEEKRDQNAESRLCRRYEEKKQRKCDGHKGNSGVGKEEDPQPQGTDNAEGQKPPRKKCERNEEKREEYTERQRRRGDKKGNEERKCEGHKDKGNNGVGNGEDPQPPGEPPQNDGSGTGKGKPGNKGKKGK